MNVNSHGNLSPTNSTDPDFLEGPVIAGLDIGTTKVAVFIARKNKFGKLHILGMGRADSNGGVKRGEVVNIQLTTEAIKKAVAIAEKKANVKVRSVFVGIAGSHIQCRQNPGLLGLGGPDTEVTREHLQKMHEDIRNVALPPGERIIQISPQEFKIDDMTDIIDPIGHFGSRIETNFNIITGRITAATHIQRCIERAGLHMEDLYLEPLASSSAVLTEQEKEAGVVLVDIGGGTTDIAIFKEKILRYTGVIPLAGNIITEDIKEGCKVLRQEAEQLKVRHGSALPDGFGDNKIISIPGIEGRPVREVSMKTLSEIIKARMEEIFEHVYTHIQRSGYFNKIIAGVVVTGGGSQLKHLPQMIEYTTGLSTRVGYPSVHTAKETPAELNSPMYATGIGLVLNGFDYIQTLSKDSAVQFSSVVQPIPLIEESAPAEQKQIEDKKEKSPVEKTHQVEQQDVRGRIFTYIKRWFDDDQVDHRF